MTVTTILEHPLLRRLSHEQRQTLLAGSRRIRFASGAVIFREGSEAESLYLLHSGRVVLEQHVPGKGTVQLEELRAGDLLGLSWLFPASRWSLDARAAEETDTTMLDAAHVRQRMAADPALGLGLTMELIPQLYRRLERVRLQRLDIYKAER